MKTQTTTRTFTTLKLALIALVVAVSFSSCYVAYRPYGWHRHCSSDIKVDRGPVSHLS